MGVTSDFMMILTFVVLEAKKSENEHNETFDKANSMSA